MVPSLLTPPKRRDLILPHVGVFAARRLCVRLRGPMKEHCTAVALSTQHVAIRYWSASIQKHYYYCIYKYTLLRVSGHLNTQVTLVDRVVGGNEDLLNNTRDRRRDSRLHLHC